MVPGEVSRAVRGNGYARAGEEFPDFGHVLMMAHDRSGFVPPGRALFHGVGYRPVREKIQGRAFFHRAFPDSLPDLVDVGGNVPFSMARENLVFNSRGSTVVQRIVLVNDSREPVPRTGLSPRRGPGRARARCHRGAFRSPFSRKRRATRRRSARSRSLP